MRSTKGDAPGMRGYRTRDNNGELRKKRSDTLVRTIEKKYDVDLQKRGDTKLGTILKEKGLDSLDDLLKSL